MLFGPFPGFEGPAGEDFSEDYTVYALGVDQGDSSTIFLFETAEGRLLWKKRFKERLLGLKLAGPGVEETGSKELYEDFK